MVYQQCGPLCPQTCDNIGTSDCHGGCAEGCFCPYGQVLSEGRCIDPIACPGLYYIFIWYSKEHVNKKKIVIVYLNSPINN